MGTAGISVFKQMKTMKQGSNPLPTSRLKPPTYMPTTPDIVLIASSHIYCLGRDGTDASDLRSARADPARVPAIIFRIGKMRPWQKRVLTESVQPGRSRTGS